MCAPSRVWLGPQLRPHTLTGGTHHATMPWTHAAQLEAKGTGSDQGKGKRKAGDEAAPELQAMRNISRTVRDVGDEVASGPQMISGKLMVHHSAWS